MKIGKKWINKETNELFRAILALQNVEEARRFFRDLLTEQEILEFTNRWKVAKMLANKIPYSEIEEKTGMSSTTIARISKWLSNGMSGYKLMLARFGIPSNNPHHHHEHTASLEDGS